MNAIRVRAVLWSSHTQPRHSYGIRSGDSEVHLLCILDGEVLHSYLWAWIYGQCLQQKMVVMVKMVTVDCHLDSIVTNIVFIFFSGGNFAGLVILCSLGQLLAKAYFIARLVPEIWAPLLLSSLRFCTYIRWYKSMTRVILSNFWGRLVDQDIDESYFLTLAGYQLPITGLPWNSCAQASKELTMPC